MITHDAVHELRHDLDLRLSCESVLKLLGSW